MKSKIKKNRKVGAKRGRPAKKIVKPPMEDKFWDGDSNVTADDARVTNPSKWEIRDEVSQMDSFRDFARESRGNNLTYGDY